MRIFNATILKNKTIVLPAKMPKIMPTVCSSKCELIAQFPPLIRHRGGNTSISLAAQSPTIGSRSQLVLTACSLIVPSSAVSRQNLGRNQQRQSTQPQTCGLAFGMTKHPRLNRLLRFADSRADAANRILDAQSRNRQLHDCSHEI